MQHLQKMAAADSNFKERFEDKNKNIDDCHRQVQAKKEAENNVAVISNEDVFKWAAHYYQEKDIKVEPADSCSIQTIKKEKKETKPKALELDLFGGLL